MSNPRKVLAEYDPRKILDPDNLLNSNSKYSPSTTGQNAKHWVQKCDTAGRPENGASHQIWAI